MNGHKTRFSDSSFYDEVCIYCGATDRDSELDASCPIGSDLDLLNHWRTEHDDMGRRITKEKK